MSAKDATRTDPINGPRRPYPAEKARQGRIILQSATRRRIFIVGLAAIVIMLFGVALVA